MQLCPDRKQGLDQAKTVSLLGELFPADPMVIGMLLAVVGLLPPLAGAIAAARALRGACSAPMAVDLEAMAPWHRLMMRVWSLSSLLRAAGVALPEGG